MMTSEPTERRFPGESGSCKTFQSADLLGHKPNQGVVSGSCFKESMDSLLTTASQIL
jgi:hypothetical protein